MSDLKVGDSIWCFDINRRKYAPPEPGCRYPTGGPIYREHWRQVEITGETSRSWVTLYGKCPKRGGHGWALTEAEVDDDVWAHDHRYKISNRICHRYDVPASVLREIAKLIGYEV